MIKLVQWMSNPENRDKIKSVVRFLTNNGPKLLAAYLLFGTRFGRAVVRLSGLLIKGAIRLGAASLFLLKKLGLKGAGGLARALLGGRGRALGTGLQLAATAGGFFALEKLFDGDDGGDDDSGEMPGFSGGGLVDGPYGSDEVNARLTDGEFVMSAPATAAIGPAVLEDLNAKYGGTNKPRMVNGTLMAQEGGMVNRERATQAGMFSTRIGRGVLDNIGYGSGDFMFKGLPAGVEYNPAFSGAGDKLFGLNPQGKKLTDLFGLRGAFGELADTQYFSPDLGTAMKYAGEGGSVVVMPRTSGFSSFKNPLGSNVMRGFDPSKGIEQLVRTSDSVTSAAAGTTRVMNMNKESTSKALDNLKWLLAIIVFGIAVVGNSYFVEVAFLYRVLAVLALFIVGLVLIALTSFGSNALKLMKESRTEIRKVVWPTRMETTQTFMIVFGAIIILCLFFWGLESLLTFLTRLVLG